jgi:hypothetical protein
MAKKLMRSRPVACYGALCDALSTGDWRARGNAAFLLSKIKPPTEAWRHEALGRLRHRISCEPRSEVKAVMQRTLSWLDAADGLAPVRATSPRRPAAPPSSARKARPTAKRNAKPAPSAPSVPEGRPYAIDADGSIIWL